MKHLYQIGFIVSFWLYAFALHATHLVGGELSYKCLGNNNYEITLIIYRDCYNGQAPLDASVSITIYNQNNIMISNDDVPLYSVTTLPLKAPNNCTTLPNNVCTEKGIYIDTVNLPPIAGGYTITHQRCCRNSTITNINNSPDQWGSTYTTTIPPNDSSCNSSPKFTDDPPVVLCLNQPVALDLNANDLDGDSVYYELCSILHGGSVSNPIVAVATPPPYIVIPFISGFSTTYPIASSPPFTIDHTTGILSGTPTQVGQFVFAICASDYRNGNLISTNRRDFQFNVSASCLYTTSIIQSQFANPINICSNGTVHFKNLSLHATHYHWDFGDTTTTADTSNLKNPTYFYPDTGKYLVTLIANPGTDCADTNYSIFEIYDSTKVHYTFDGDLCFASNSVNFAPSGSYTGQATFLWDFDGTTNLGNTSTLKFPQSVRFKQPGTHYVTVTVTDFDCSDTYGDSVDIFPNPIIGEKVEEAHECSPYTVQFIDQTYAYGPVQQFWWFGDGDFSNLPNPVHTYKSAGIYTVEHAIKTLRGCLDSGYSKYDNIIEVFPKPHSELDISPKIQDIYNPSFSLENTSEGQSRTQTFLPDGRVLEDLQKIMFTITDTGKFVISQITYNGYGCTDTIYDTLQVTSPFNIWVPNAFTPNGDGINDLFNYKLTGAEALVMMNIYNRWGEIVYRSDNPIGGWNGKMDNTGEALPPGIYTYVLIVGVKDGGGYNYTKRGTVNLLR